MGGGLKEGGEARMVGRGRVGKNGWRGEGGQGQVKGREAGGEGRVERQKWRGRQNRSPLSFLTDPLRTRKGGTTLYR